MTRAETLLFVLAAGVPLLASAADSQFSVDVGVGTTNNIARVPADEQSETIISAGTQFAVTHQSRRLDANIAGDLAWYEYSGNDYDSELVGTVNAAMRFSLLENHLSWDLDDSFGQTRLDLFTAPSPLNRENINYASTGPNLQFQLGDQLQVIAQARYALVSYQTSPLDSTRKSALLGLQHDLSPSASVSLNASRERVEADGDAAFPSYDKDEAYLRYAGQGAHTTVSVDAGASRLDQADTTSNSALVRVALSRTVGGWSTLTARVGREQIDAAGTLSLDGGQQLPAATLNTQSLSQTAAPYVNSYLDLGWQIAGRVTSIGFSAEAANENYDGASAQDRHRGTFNATATRQFGPHLSGHATLQYSKYDYLHLAGDNNEKDAELGLSWRIGRKLSAEVTGAYYGYSSENIAGTAKEQRYWLRLRYGNAISS